MNCGALILLCGDQRGLRQEFDQPRPMNGILVAITVMNCTFESSGSEAMKTTERATSCTSIVGSGATEPLAWGMPVFMFAAMPLAALPMSIWPQAMLYLRPSSEVERVSPVIACFVEV